MAKSSSALWFGLLSLEGHTTHARQRTQERCEALGVPWHEVLRVVSLKAKNNRWGDYAVKVRDLPINVGSPWSRSSNGNQVWAIVRGGAVQTVMLRRSTQPTKPENFGVDVVYL